MQKLRVELGQRSYDIFVGTNLLAGVGGRLREMGFSHKAVMVTDASVGDLYAGHVKQGLAGAGFKATVLSVPPGEAQKTLETAGKLYMDLIDAGIERGTPILALGGGVIGDLAGFVAATYLRGVPLVQVPTTLLAQVDSSVGGKTAVDHGGLKNVVGAFYQPRLVIADIDTLKTLPETEFTNGMAEVIKHAAIRSRDLFDFIDTNLDQIKARGPGALEKVIGDNIRIKAAVVEEDETETGPRAILNFGHTVGHGVEAVSGFALKHGEAVATGMVAAARLSCRMGFMADDEAGRLEKAIAGAGLPTQPPRLDRERLMAAIRHDKKVRQGKFRFVLLRSIGDAFISDDVDPALVEEVVFGEE